MDGAGGIAGVETSVDARLLAVCVIFFGVGVVLVRALPRLMRDHRRPERWLALVIASCIVFLVLGVVGPWPLALFALFLLPLVIKGISDLKLSRRMASAPVGSSGVTPPVPARVAPPGVGPPPLRLVTVVPAEIDPPSNAPATRGFYGGPGTVSPGIPILFLWVFSVAPNQQVLAMARLLGPTYLLRGGGYLTPELQDMVARIFDDAGDHVEETDGEVDMRIASFDTDRGRWRYPQHSLLCTDAVWKRALDQLVGRSRVVLIDLGEYTAGRAGCEYELGAVLDRLPAGRLIVLVRPSSDMPAVNAALDLAWSTMAVDSPNRLGGGQPLQLAEIRHLTGNAVDHDPMSEAELRGMQRMIIDADRDTSSRWPPPPCPAPVP